jgi:hypothetical protein
LPGGSWQVDRCPQRVGIPISSIVGGLVEESDDRHASLRPKVAVNLGFPLPRFRRVRANAPESTFLCRSDGSRPGSLSTNLTRRRRRCVLQRRCRRNRNTASFQAHLVARQNGDRQRLGSRGWNPDSDAAVKLDFGHGRTACQTLLDLSLGRRPSGIVSPVVFESAAFNKKWDRVRLANR